VSTDAGPGGAAACTPEPLLRLRDFIASFETSPLARWRHAAPWELTGQSDAIVRCLLRELKAAEFRVDDDVAVHHTATVEPGAVLKGPLVIGPHCFVAAGAYLRGGNCAGAYLRGGNWIAEHCTFGPGAELKSSFVFAGTKLAHFNFVGDSVLGADVNLEAGSIVCNYRNERDDKGIRVRLGDGLHRIACVKFGALIGDHGRIGANAVLAPGAVLRPRSRVRRGALQDDEESGPAVPAGV
jgi:NDP-sugar pyrophosphorylase family protein